MPRGAAAAAVAAVAVAAVAVAAVAAVAAAAVAAVEESLELAGDEELASSTARLCCRSFHRSHPLSLSLSPTTTSVWG